MINILKPTYSLLLVLVIYSTSSILYAQPFQPSTQASEYQELVDLFIAWREFRAPVMMNGVPDYTAQAMQSQQKELVEWQSRLAAIDTTSSIPRCPIWMPPALAIPGFMWGLRIYHQAQARLAVMQREAAVRIAQQMTRRTMRRPR